MTSVITWHRASEQLPPEGQRVLLYRPGTLQHQRPFIAALRAGDPARDGLYAATDQWVLDSSGFTTQTVRNEDYWAHIELPEEETK